MMSTEYITLLALLIGFILDAIIGDPYSWPHPIKLFGNCIAFGEKKLNTKKNRFAKGAVLTSLLIGLSYGAFYFIAEFSAQHAIASLVIVSVFVFYGLANHTLIKEGLKVNSVLELEGLEAGRKQLSYIVGRDTSQLSAQEIRTAVLETLAENLSDGVIAPMFYYAIGGIPAMFAYKMINTLDSMIGYKSERYFYFGKFAAIVDDIANYIPARLTALLMVLVSFSYRGFSFIFKFGHKHASPNAGYPESALAGILNCRFGGPNVYHGKLVDKPYIGENEREITFQDIKKAAVVNAATSFVMLILCSIYLMY
ncbi:adenosylcobinamide-phosphate synthase CbiB [Saccharicrinis aurantiacus]|uniref:adenosylcobinamide-phosphate synthase CbiB n=1 Tax=Saccharicrinis aurantiacus TaxID=1849719 RepID=UPI000B191628|nr:adenosylcobinamide-phosphate synthase CbiB [Saccharicrinis aurantiacus]